MDADKGMALFQQTVLTHHLSAMDKVSFKNFIDPFQNILDCTRFDIDKLSRKLQNWHELTFKQFLKELKKKKVDLSLSEEAEWMEYFNRQKTQAEVLKSQIAQTDKEVDGMVYELYGLGEEERKVV